MNWNIFLEVKAVQDINGDKLIEAMINNSSIALDNSTRAFSSSGQAIGIFLILFLMIGLIVFFFGGAILNFFFPRV